MKLNLKYCIHETTQRLESVQPITPQVAFGNLSKYQLSIYLGAFQRLILYFNSNFNNGFDQFCQERIEKFSTGGHTQTDGDQDL